MMAVATRTETPGQATDDTQSVHAGTAGIRQLVRERLALSDDADPHALADAIAADLPDEQLRAVVREGVLCVVLHEVRRTRRATSTPAPSPKSAKWEGIAQAVAANPGVFQRRYKTPHSPTGWKFLGDFTKADAEWNRDQHTKLAAAVQQRAHAFDVLAKRLRPAGILRDQLKPEDVEEIFNA